MGKRPIQIALGLSMAAGCSKNPGTGSTAPTPEPVQAHAEPDHADGHGHGSPGHHEHRFENADDWTARFDDPERDSWQKPAHVALVLAIGPGMTVADLGAGTGYFLATFSAAVGDAGKVLALDIEPDMVRHMTERARKEGLANVEARVVAASDPELADNSVDRIVIVNTWHHIADRVDYAKKLAAALREGGTVAIVDFTAEAPQGPPAELRLSIAKVIEELEAGGLRAQAIDEELGDQYIVIGRR